MNRYENGKQTTNVTINANRVNRWDAMTQLDSAMFGTLRVVQRRIQVIDRVNGTLLGIVVFQHPGSDRSPEIISEFFKISEGRIRQIRAVMAKSPTAGWN